MRERIAGVREWAVQRWRFVAPGLIIPIAVIASLLVVSPWSSDSGDEAETLATGTPAATRRPPTPTRRATSSPSPSATGEPTASPTQPPQTFTVPPTAPPTAVPTPAPTYSLVQALPAASFGRMVDFALIPGKPDEAIVVTQHDRILWRISLSGSFAATVYGDLTGFVGCCGNEEGLLSATFSPNFQSDGRIYVYYTRGSPQPSVLSRFQVAGNAMDTTNETVILTIPQFETNHNGGRALFGPDGYLYLSLGDGGGGGDPQENSQNLTSLLGKLLRIRVTGESSYGIPAENPFADGPGGSADEIYAYGFRNPWRFSFDRATGALWLGDVGQGSWEEVDVVLKGGNYGWDCYEGYVTYETDGCPAGGFQQPRAVYSTHEGGSCAVTGGYVYRGSAMPELVGRYIFGDYCSGRIWALDSGNPAAQPILLLDSPHNVASFGETADGELLVLTFSNAVFRLTRQ